MKTIRRRLFGHKWRADYELLPEWEIAYVVIPSFIFPWLVPYVAPKRGRYLGEVCQRCNAEQPRYTITARGRAMLEGKDGTR